MKYIVILTNKWTDSVIVYPDLFDNIEAAQNGHKYDAVNWRVNVREIQL